MNVVDNHQVGVASASLQLAVEMQLCRGVYLHTLTSQVCYQTYRFLFLVPDFFHINYLGNFWLLFCATSSQLDLLHIWIPSW